MGDQNDRIDVWTVDGQAYTVPREQAKQALAAGLLLSPPAPPAKRPVMEQIAGLDRSLGQGATFGFGDEIAAGVGATVDKLTGKPWMESYDKRLKTERDLIHNSEKDHPYLSFGANVVGGLANPVVGAARGLTLAKKMAAAMKTGAAVGGATGFGAADGDLGDRMWGAAKGTGIGLTLGAAVPVAGAAVRGTAQKAADALSDVPVVGPVLSHMPGVKPPGAERGAEKVIEALQRDGLSLKQAEARYMELSHGGTKPVTVADLGRENVRGLADAVMIPPTSTRADAAQFLVERSANSGGRVIDDLAQATGLTKDLLTVSESLVAKREADAAPAYEKAYELGKYGIQDPGIVEFLKRPAFQAALRKGYEIAGNKGVELPKIFDDAGNITHYPNLQILDFVKRGLDDLVFTGKRDGSLVATNLGAVKNARAEFLRRIDNYIPEYAEARAAYAGPTQLLEAAEAGTKFAKMRPEEITHLLTKEIDTPAEREHFLLGAVDTIRHAIQSAPDGADTWKKVFGNVTKREQLRALFPSKEAYARFEAQMETERQMRITADAVRGNSRAAYRLWALDDLGNEPGSFTANALTRGFRSAVGTELIGRAQGNVGKNAEAAVPILFGDPMKALETLKRTHQKIQQQGKAPNRSASPLSVVGGLLGAR